MLARGVVLAAVVLSLAACGGGRRPSTATPSLPCTEAGSPQVLRRLDGEIAAIRRAARLPTKDTLKGNAAINRATDAFLYDVEVSAVTNLARNRLIDHAAGALVGECEQCFQALEAARPIVKMAHGGACGA